ncbi:MAG: S-layer homology domain-containing protein [Selenomonadaceae bacterium]|nr:S-layer homology domain-containing protein [Selenomonadaceae bacterium]
MKKFIIPALTSALIIGTASTSFAAQNPFSDVNEHHWAYQSVLGLAEAGIITGYDNSDAGLNGKFVGNRNITRYEMAQMIAKTLARIEGESSPFNIQLRGHQWTFVDNSGVRRVVDGTVVPFKLNNGAVVDMQKLDELMNLLIEFREELDTIGIRVQDLEDHSDKVKWTGELRYRYWNDKTTDSEKDTLNQFQIRLFPTAKLDDHWTAKARFTASLNMEEDTTGNAKLTFVYADGKYDKLNIQLGKMPFVSKADSGLVMDDFFSGGRITYGDKFKINLEAGRWNLKNSNLEVGSDASNYVGGDLLYDDDNRFNFGLGYRHFKSDKFANADGYGDNNKANIVSVGAGYKFGDFELDAAYAKNTKADEYNKGYNVELSYAGADRTPGSWGAFIAYRYAGNNVSLSPTYDSYGISSNKKGFDFGVSWSPFKNTLTELSYFRGKTLDTRKTNKSLFGRVSFFF